MKKQYIHMRYYIVLFVIGSYVTATTLALLLLLVLDLKITGFILVQLLSFHALFFAGIILNNKKFIDLKKETDSFLMGKQIHSSDQLNEFMKEFYNTHINDRQDLIKGIFSNTRPIELYSEKESAISFYSRLNTNEKDIILSHYAERIQSTFVQEDADRRFREKFDVDLQQQS